MVVKMVWTDDDLPDSPRCVAQIPPSSAVAITHRTFRDPPSLVTHWKECIFADSAMYGSVRKQVWSLYIWWKLEISMLYCDPVFRSTCWLAGAYREDGKTPQKDELGAVRVIPFGRVSGLTVMVGNAKSQRYSSSSHIPQVTMSEIWAGEPRWPRCEEQGWGRSIRGNFSSRGATRSGYNFKVCRILLWPMRCSFPAQAQ